MNSDPFHLLGLAPESSPDEWKRAYRRLAMRWHPDRNPHPEATERFKLISAAYEQLLATLDSGEFDENPPSTATDEAPARAPDIRLTIEVTVDEGALGCRKTVTFFRRHHCAKCAGTGEAGLARTRFCPACHGSGRIRDAERVLISCTACHGRGFFSERICPDCAGLGHERHEVVLEISVPPGMLSGDELRLAGQGEAGAINQGPGDLYLTVVLATHPLYRLHGRDVHYAMPVGVLALLAGAEFDLPTPCGNLRHSLLPGSGDCREIRLPGRGYPGRGKKAAGELVVTLQAVFPKRLDARHRLQLLKIHGEMLDQAADYLPEIVAWQRLLATDGE